jgi:hypothetical protein
VEALERDRLAERAGHTGNHFAKTWRLRDQTRNRRQHVHWVSLDHYRIHFETTAGSASGIEAHQYNPSYMLVSTPARVAIVIAALVVVVLGYRWWASPERHVHVMLADVASALSHDDAETELRAIAAVASIQSHLAPDISIDMDSSSTSLRGRPDVISMAARFRAARPLVRVQFFDPEIQFSSDSAGTTRVTVQVTTRDIGGEEVADARVVSIALVKADGRWQIASARVLAEDASL